MEMSESVPAHSKNIQQRSQETKNRIIKKKKIFFKPRISTSVWMNPIKSDFLADFSMRFLLEESTPRNF